MTNWRAHPFKTTSVGVLTLGGLLLLLFFCQLGDMPDINLASSTSILAAVAMVGLLVAIVIGASTVAPGLVLHGPNKDTAWLRSVPTMLLSATPGIALVLVMALQFVLEIEWFPAPNTLGLCAAMAWVIADARVHHLTTKGEIVLKDVGKRRVLHYWANVGALAYHSMFWILCIALVVLSLFHLYRDEDHSVWLFCLTAVMWVGFCCAMNVFLVTSQDRATPRVVVSSIGFALLMLMTLTRNYTGIAVAAVRATGQGGDIPVRLVVTAKGCEILNKAVSGDPVCAAANADDPAVVCPVVLRSKIGTPFFIEFKSASAEGAWPSPGRGRMVSLAKSEVLSWPRIEPLKALPKPSSMSPAASATASGPLLSFLRPLALAKTTQHWLEAECGQPIEAVAAPAGSAPQSASE